MEQKFTDMFFEDDNIEDIALSVQNGDYQETQIEDDHVETLMDADDDLDDEAIGEDTEYLLAQNLREECIGADPETHLPRGVFAVMLFEYNTDTERITPVAEKSGGNAVIEINKRGEFVEYVLTFSKADKADLKVLLAHLSKFDAMLNAVTPDSVTVPDYKLVIAPRSAYGAVFIMSHLLVAWSLASNDPDELPRQIKLLYRAEYTNIYQSDEDDITDIIADVRRENELSAANEAALNDAEAQRQANVAERNRITEESRRHG